MNGDVAAGLLAPADAASRRDVAREIERQIQRAIWRAERRGRGLPAHVRQGMRWINAQRRKMAHELVRAMKSLGAGAELATAIATKGCDRFPRDGVVLADVDGRPRSRGEAPRQRGTNPRAREASPRQRGTSPRQQRAAADLSVTVATTVATGADRTLERATIAPAEHEHSAVHRSISELAPEWAAIKAGILEELEPHEKRRAHRAGRAERERIERAQKAHPSTT